MVHHERSDDDETTTSVESSTPDECCPNEHEPIWASTTQGSCSQPVLGVLFSRLSILAFQHSAAPDEDAWKAALASLIEEKAALEKAMVNIVINWSEKEETLQNRIVALDAEVAGLKSEHVSLNNDNNDLKTPMPD